MSQEAKLSLLVKDSLKRRAFRNSGSKVEQIVTAARSGQVSEVESLLQQPRHPDPELLDARGCRRGSALAVASSQGHVEIVSLLLEAGADKHRDFGTASLTAIGALAIG